VFIIVKKTAEDFAKEQKEISVSEFFEKNKHLLGFDNPTKALMMTVKEAVDNALDACQDAGIVPDITVKIKQSGEDKYVVSVQDNGPGIVKEQIGRIFGKLLYGSKFHKLRQSRGQQGIGISAVVLYSQLTTGNPAKVWSKVESKKKTHYFEMHLNTMKNEPEVIKEEDIDYAVLGESGIKIEITVVGRYRKTIEDYLKQTSIANPFAKINFTSPDGTKITYPRSINELPKEPKIMKPHPYGMEFGTLQRMLHNSSSRTLQSFMTNEFSSVGAQTAKELCKVAKLDANSKPESLDRDAIEKVMNAVQKVKIQRPPLDCLSPIGESELEKSLRKEYPNAEFITTITREPTVYRGFPFMIEAGIVYDEKDIEVDDEKKKGDAIDVLRIANRVPLLYQSGACATIEAVKDVDWKRYGLSQSANSLPTGPVKVVIHMCSVWVPFISESKEAIAPYPDIVKEMKLAIQDAGRNFSRFLSGRRRAGEQKRRVQIFERYANEVANSIAGLTGKQEKEIEKKLLGMIKNRVKIIEKEIEEENNKNGVNNESNKEETKKDEKPKQEKIKEKK